ncbi:ATP12 family chaperone protein [Frigidibacter oleivorans]|uniref:ATP12 family chaperone protein n=1 Tax=Frigidibacter oleivorans TaxID=2487129 RepID=UPI000F8D643E|nr:ATP12 family protein [Frigidibacter oleivorans]
MSEWKARRFWTAAAVEPAAGGFAVTLDGRPVRTPGKRPLVLPTRALAEAVAAEWQAQGDTVDPRAMPVTRAANSALDTVAQNRASIEGMIAAYGASDLLCYRAEAPEALVARQAAEWDPLLDWAARDLGAPLRVTAGVVPVDQPPESLAALAARLAALTDMELTAMHDLVALSGSLVLGLAAADGLHPPEDIWRLSRIDEDHQASEWGVDEEAAEVAARKRADFLQAHRLLRLARAE